MKRQSIRLVNMKISFVVFLFFLLNFPIHGTSNFFQTPFRYCSNATFSPNSSYLSNLNILFSALSSIASRKLYHNSSATTVYGDYQCRGDLNATACQHCVATATTNSSQSYCPLNVMAVIWLDQCFLRYSNRPFFSLLRKHPSMSIYNQKYMDEDGRNEFNKIVVSTLNDTIANASSSNKRLLGTKEASFETETIYTLAQCTMDLSTSNCRKCLIRAAQIIPSCCNGRKGARVLLFSCTVRYELYPFYDGVSVSSVPTPPSLEPPPSSPAVLPPPPQYPPDWNRSLVPPSLPSSPSAPLPPSTAPPSLLSGKGKKRMVMAMVICIIVVGG